jgi:hypothetical protein
VRTGGLIINFSTSVARLQIPHHGAYAASKEAVEPLTQQSSRHRSSSR